LIFNCSEVFPVFDQPDLKAQMTLKILTHKEWVAVSNSPEEGIFEYDSEEYLNHLKNSEVQWMEGFFGSSHGFVDEHGIQ
jgi:hypothetical protein